MTDEENIFTDISEVLIENGADFVNNDKYGFSRTLEIKCLDILIRFILYHNVCTAMIGTTEIRFTNIIISETWPNSYKKNILLYNKNEIVSVIPIEKYKTKEK